jgi:hypothetical protein
MVSPLRALVKPSYLFISELVFERRAMSLILIESKKAIQTHSTLCPDFTSGGFQY